MGTIVHDKVTITLPPVGPGMGVGPGIDAFSRDAIVRIPRREAAHKVLSPVAEHSASSCLKCSHGSGSRFIASLLQPLTRWVSPMRKVSRSFLPDCPLCLGLMWFVCGFFLRLLCCVRGWVGPEFLLVS